MDDIEQFKFLETLIPKNEWDTILKISIFYKEFMLLKLFVLINSKWVYHRNYYLRITYKNKSIQLIKISYNLKELIKPHITSFNYYVNGLAI
jgi:uncharacterized protein YpbB